MNLKARYFDGKTSASQDVEVHLAEDGIIRIDGFSEPFSTTLAQIKISERIGNTPRRLRFGDGAVCELTDNDAVDHWLDSVGGHSLEHRVFRLERLWIIAVAALLFTGVAAWLGLRYGVPALAGHAVKIIPTSFDAKIGRESMELLDKGFFTPSQLSFAQQAAIRADFERIVADVGDHHDYRLEFRQGGPIGANAFALPSGIVVMTDELVNLSEDPNEITAVLAHEVGHVVHRHALRTLIQSSATAAIMAGVLGDLTSISALIASAPAVLLQAKYSRGLETEADDFSYAWLKQHNIPTHYFGDFLLRMETQHDKEHESKPGAAKGDKTKDDKNDAFGYFSSHPRTRDRVHE